MSVKRHEPVAWTTPEQLRKFPYGYVALMWASPQLHEEGEISLYSAETVAALEAEAAELRNKLESYGSALADVLGGIYSGAIKCKPLMTKVDGDFSIGSVAEMIENTLESPKDALTQPEPDDE